MKILFVSYLAPPVRSARATRVSSIGRHFLEKGHDLTVVTVDVDGDDRHGEEKLAGARFIRTPPGPIEQFRSASKGFGPSTVEKEGGRRRSIIPRARRILLDYAFPDVQVEWMRSFLRRTGVGPHDVVISFVHPFTGALVGDRIAAELGVPHIIDYGDPWCTRLVPRPALLKRLEFALEKFILRRARGVVSNSPTTVSLMKQTFPEIVDMECVLSGYDPDEYAPLPEPPPGIGARTLLHLGDIYGVRLPLGPLGQALSEHAWFEGLDAYGKTSHRGLPSSVRACGTVSFAESLTLMQQAGALLLLGNEGGLQIPSKIYAYLGSGRPVLAILDTETDPIASFDVGDQLVCVPNRVPEILRGLDIVAERSKTQFSPPQQFSWHGQAESFLRLLERWCGEEGLSAT